MEKSVCFMEKYGDTKEKKWGKKDLSLTHTHSHLQVTTSCLCSVYEGQNWAAEQQSTWVYCSLHSILFFDFYILFSFIFSSNIFLIRNDSLKIEDDIYWTDHEGFYTVFFITFWTFIKLMIQKWPTGPIKYITSLSLNDSLKTEDAVYQSL